MTTFNRKVSTMTFLLKKRHQRWHFHMQSSSTMIFYNRKVINDDLFFSIRHQQSEMSLCSKKSHQRWKFHHSRLPFHVEKSSTMTSSYRKVSTIPISLKKSHQRWPFHIPSSSKITFYNRKFINDDLFFSKRQQHINVFSSTVRCYYTKDIKDEFMF